MPNMIPHKTPGASPDLSRLQRFFKWWMSPETFAAHKAQSEKWIVACPHCGLRRNIWELGGMRGGATGKPATRLRCPSCNKSGWHPVRFEP